MIGFLFFSDHIYTVTKYLIFTFLQTLFYSVYLSLLHTRNIFYELYYCHIKRQGSI